MKKNLFEPTILLAWQEIDELHWKVLVIDITKSFFDAGSIQMKQLNQAWANRNLEEVSKAAHLLKSSCGSVGAYEAHGLLDQVEKASACADTEKVTALMTEVQPLFSESCIQINEFVKKLQAA